MITGWIVICGWMAILAGSGYLCGAQIQAVIQLNNPDYLPERWQGTLIFWATVLVAVIINTVLGRLLLAIEILMLIVHVLGFFAVLVPLLAVSLFVVFSRPVRAVELEHHTYALDTESLL